MCQTLQARQEIVSKRNLHSKIYLLNKHTYQLEMSSTPLHYLDENGIYRDINLDWQRSSDGYFCDANIVKTKASASGITIVDRETGAALEILQLDGRNAPLVFAGIEQSRPDRLKVYSDKTDGSYTLLAGGMRINQRSPNRTFRLRLKSNNIDLNQCNVSSKGLSIGKVFEVFIDPLNRSTNGSGEKDIKIISRQRSNVIIEFSMRKNNLNANNLQQSVVIQRTVNGGLIFNDTVKRDGSEYDFLEGLFFSVSADAGDRGYRYVETWNIDDTRIPDNATILSAIHTIQLTPGQNQNVDVKVVSVSFSAYNQDAQQHWQAIGSGAQYDVFNPQTIGDTYTKTYTGGSFCSNIQSNLSNDGFIVGLKILDENNFGHVCNFTGGTTLSITYQAPENTIVKNDFESGRIIVDYQEGDSPIEVLKLKKESIQMMAIDGQNYGGYTRMWDKWSLPLGGTDTNLEHIETIENNSLKTFTANFKKAYEVTVNHTLLNGGTTNPDINIIIENQSGYIEVQPKTVTVNGEAVDYKFLHWWDGSTQNPRLFTPQGHESYDAIMKGQQVSNSTTALSHNGGRKIWSTPLWNGVNGPGQRVAYEDNGDIYYTEYVFNSFNYYWTDEILLSDGSGNNSLPCITANADEAAFVVWQRFDSGANKYDVVFRQRDEANGSWHTPQVLATTTTATQPKPVVGASDLGGVIFNWHVVWQNGNGLRYARIDDEDTAAENTGIPGTNSNAANPSITEAYQESKLGIAWENSGDIFYIPAEVSSTPFPSGTSPQNISGGFCDLSNNKTPSITGRYDGTEQMLSWSGWYEPHACNPEFSSHLQSQAGGLFRYIIAAQRRNSSGQWGYSRFIYYGSTYNNITPSAGWDVYLGDAYCYVLWNVQNQNKIGKIDYQEGSGWNTQVEIFSGSGYQTPNLGSYGDGGNPAIWLENSSSPFALHHEPLAPLAVTAKASQSPTIHPTMHFSRYANFALNQVHPALKGSLRITIEGLENAAASLPFAESRRDSIAFLSSAFLMADSQNADLTIRIALEGRGIDLQNLPHLPNFDILKLMLRKKPENGHPHGQDLQTVGRYKWNDLLREISSGDFRLEKTFAANTRPWRNKTVYLDLNVLEDFENEAQFVEEIFIDDGQQNTLAGEQPASVVGKENTHSQAQVTEFALHPAFPNPFNPTTTLQFDLPQPSNVQLRIYDLSGRLIRQLAKGMFVSGQHQLVWDGRDSDGAAVASGVYIYRLNAGAFVQSRKMLLIR